LAAQHAPSFLESGCDGVVAGIDEDRASGLSKHRVVLYAEDSGFGCAHGN
jgi:hypothetical protein